MLEGIKVYNTDKSRKRTRYQIYKITKFTVFVSGDNEGDGGGGSEVVRECDWD